MNTINLKRFVLACSVVSVTACGPTPSPESFNNASKQNNNSLSKNMVELTPDVLASSLKFYESTLPAYLISIRGLAAQESFGRWSIAKLVILDFNGYLPDEVEIEIVLGGFGPNIGADLEVIVGTEIKKIKIKSDISHMEPYLLRFANSEKVSSIVLLVPYPSSPRALGIAENDPRLLGVALQSMTIKPIIKSK